MTTFRRRVAPLALVGALLLALAPPAAAADATTFAQAERRVVALLNEQRAAVGLLPLRVDARLRTIARARSADMVAKGYFDHQQPDGRWAWDLMNETGITWYAAGEIIAWNRWSTLSASATAAATQWRDSAPHYALVTSTTYNYFGVGLAVDASGKKIWTTVFMKGPDRTSAWATLTTPGAAATFVIAATTATRRNVTITWTGADRPLAVLTSGLRDFAVQYRYAGTATWITLATATTSTSLVLRLTVGRAYEFRVRARDRAYNHGAWSAPATVVP